MAMIVPSRTHLKHQPVDRLEYIYMLDCGHKYLVLMSEEDYEMNLRTVPFRYKCVNCGCGSLFNNWVSVIDIMSRKQMERDSKLKQLGIYD